MMNCPQCHAEIENPGLLCPQCGAALNEPAPQPKLRPQSRPRPEPRAKKAKGTPVAPGATSFFRRLLPFLFALALFMGALTAASYAGLYFGERDREAQRQATLEAHYQAGLTALNEGRFERAVSEFQYVLQLDPTNGLAQQGLTEANARLNVQPTPTSEAEQSLAELLLERARTAYAQQDWDTVINHLTQLRRLDLDYERPEVEELLFYSLYNAGMALLDSDNLEQGIFYMDQAIALRPLAVDADAVNTRNLAARYLDALGYWGVDWQATIDSLEALYDTAPYYRDVSTRLYQAYLEFGDYYVQQGELCPAEQVYTQAIRRFGDPQGTLEQKRADSAQVCLIATPAPFDGTGPQLTPQPIPGFAMGRLAYPVYNSASGFYDLYALYAEGRIIRVSQLADQPWWEWGTGRVIYRDRSAGGISMVLPEEGVPLQLQSPLGQAWPVLSADSQRLAYAALDANGVWRIYIANTNGAGSPQEIGMGWAPAWGRSGWLAYTGCEADGVTCGIFIENPDDADPPRLLTGSGDDSAVSWAPGGNLMAYMSDVGGNWDIFLLNPEGGVQQLTYDTSDEGLPTWSPDGSRLAFISNRNGNWAIYIATLDGQNVSRIVDLGPELPGWDNQRLSWAP